MATCVWYTVIEFQPLQRVSLYLIRGWSLVIMAMVAHVWATAISDVAPSALGKLAHARVNWVFVTQPVLAELNRSALCARFPDATGFVNAYCA
jgi:hypothetical protein